MLTRGLQRPELQRRLRSTTAGGEGGRVLADRQLQTGSEVRCHTRFFKDKTKCIAICMPGSSSIHIVTSLVNNQQLYHEKRIERLITLSELYSLSWKRRLQTSQAIDRGFRRPRTQHHLQKTSDHFLLRAAIITSVSTLMVGTQQVLGNI
jgi:hypothetical protein